ncbi:hypothetical protein PG997_013366 [Apiospora hydei]|uniref:Major facilitator superfamily (MFS) profile domain-containing protein n=1 Tax=Apiospora hydei TaxID=1337664 RepID=A0ABR1V989_9PEZI
MQDTLVEESREKDISQPTHESPTTDNVPDSKPHDLPSEHVSPQNGDDSDTLADSIEYPSMWKAMLIVSGLFMGVFLVALDQTIIGTAIPKITDEFKTIQSKWAFLLAIFLFEVGSLICAVAPTSAVLIAGRAIAGLGVAGIFSGCTVITSFDAFKVGMGLGVGGVLASLFFEWRSVKEKKNGDKPTMAHVA